MPKSPKIGYFHGGCFEDCFTTMIENSGLFSTFFGITRPKSNRQLDYIFTNFDVNSGWLYGHKSDHLALFCNFQSRMALGLPPARGCARTRAHARVRARIFLPRARPRAGARGRARCPKIKIFYKTLELCLYL